MNRFCASLIVLVAFVTHAQSPSGTLPVMHLFTDNGQSIDTKLEYMGGGCYMDEVADGAFGSPDSLIRIQIKGHGNYTWNTFDKKPYHLKFKSPQSLLGMPANQHFLLLPHADDWLGYLRNTVGFELSRRMGFSYTPRQEPVELVINGDYRGLYFATEQIRVDENRVNITEQISEDNASDPSEGCWLLEIDNYASPNQIAIAVDSVHRMLVTVHSPKTMSERQRQWITQRLVHIDTLIRYSDVSDDLWTEWVDVESLARFYIIQELVDNIEAFHGSCFMTIDGTDDGKLHFGPVWDFGNAFTRGYASEQHFITEANEGFNKHWIESLVKHQQLMDCVRIIWTKFYDDGQAEINDFIDAFTSRIAGAIDANHARWPDYDTDNMLPRWATFKQFWAKRVEFLQQQWSQSGISVTDSPDISVCVSGRSIIIACADFEQLVSVYSVTGQSVYRGHAHHIDHLPPGIYIVTIGPIRQKVLIQ